MAQAALEVLVELDPQVALGRLEVQVELEVLAALVELEGLEALAALVVQEVNHNGYFGQNMINYNDTYYEHALFNSHIIV